MYPVLFRIGSYEVASYGVMLTLAFALGIFIASRRANARGLNGEAVLDCGIWIIVSALLGSRAFWVVTHWEQFRPPQGSLLDAVNPLASDGQFVGVAGLSVMGGLPAALVVGLVFFRWKKLPILDFADLMAPAVALGAGITRIGCFLNGCCFGILCPESIGVHFPPDSLPASVFHDSPIHAVQLYASFAGFAIAGFLFWLDDRRPFQGAVLFSMCTLMGLQRFGLEFIRWNEGGEIWFRIGDQIISSYQGVAMSLVLVGVAGLFWTASRGRRKEATGRT
ncbi:MAG: prolipoprotein diacylglyceryl transferase [Myxococcota bacterium]